MISSTILTLVVIPAVYGLVNGWRLAARSDARASSIAEEVTALKEAAE